MESERKKKKNGKNLGIEIKELIDFVERERESVCVCVRVC